MLEVELAELMVEQALTTGSTAIACRSDRRLVISKLLLGIRDLEYPSNTLLLISSR